MGPLYHLQTARNRPVLNSFRRRDQFVTVTVIIHHHWNYHMTALCLAKCVMLGIILTNMTVAIIITTLMLLRIVRNVMRGRG